MLKDILSISGQPGLFKLVSKGNNSLIVESLITGKRMPAHSSSKVITLEDIAIFTEEGEKPLKEVLKQIAEKENFGQTLDPNSSSKDLLAYFGNVVPDFDKDRVYASDVKKVLKWYNLLQEKQLLVFDEPEESKDDNKEE
jgi:hypothetical protein